MIPCQEDQSARRIIGQLYPDGPKCGSCGAAITGRRSLERFWRGERTYCAACDSRFTPTSGTILEGAHTTFAQFEKILVLHSLGLDTATICALTGCSRDTVHNWSAKIRFWESHV